MIFYWAANAAPGMVGKSAHNPTLHVPKGTFAWG